MDSAFNQPTSTTPRRNWQLDQCYREGCKLERELTAATEQRDRLAEALELILSYQGRFCEEDPESIAAEALIAVKGKDS
jgi:hypothetical protein